MKVKIKEKAQESVIFITLLIIIVTFSFLADNFLSTYNFINVVRQVSMLGTVAIGVVFVMIAGGMDLSIGAIMSISCVSVAYFMVERNIHPAIACVLSILIATVCGVFNGVVGVLLKVHPLIVTLGSMTLIKGISYAICGGLPINGLPSGFATLGQGQIGIIPIPVIIFFAYIIIGYFLLNKTVFGRTVYALGGNDEVVWLSGIDTNKLRVLIYTFSGFSAGLAGVILCSRVNGGVPSAGTGYEFDVMTAAILGGISIKGGEGNLPGVVGGVLIIGMLSNGLALMGTGEYVQNIIKGAVLLLAVAFDVLQNKNRKK